MAKFRLLPRFTIGTKLVGLIAILLMSSVAGLSTLSSQMFVESSTGLIQQANSDAAANLASQMRELFSSTTEKMRILGTVLYSTPHDAPNNEPRNTMQGKNPLAQNQNLGSKAERDRVIAEFFAKDKDLLGVYLGAVQTTEATAVTPLFNWVSRAISPELVAMKDPQGDATLGLLVSDPNLSLQSVTVGEVQLSSINLTNGGAAISLAIPFIENPQDPGKFTHILVSVMRQNRFLKTFSESEVITSFMVDRRGKVLAHPDPEVVTTKENFSNLPIVKELLSGKFHNGQTRYVDPRTGQARLGAFRVVGMGGLGVVAEVAEAKAFEGAIRVVYRAALIAWIILCIAFLTGYLYSGTITWPIKRLAAAAHEISKGNFKIHLKSKGQDELAQLSSTFNEMAQGLEERDRVKETFNKFHNKEIAEKLLSGEVKLGGERKEATVFFSDVRGFTGMSESMEPEQVVEMLNEYMTRMVAIIRSYRGVVDKYVGDAIMAIWGVPISTDEDSYNAVRACIAMREDLAQLNTLRTSRGQPVIKIGMGLNAGPLIAGNIGSDEKMEYTVIGDAVNLASRIESMTKEYGTDLLVSTSVYEKIKDRFIFEKAASTRVKGKSEPIDVYRVLGYIDEKGAKVIVATPYSSYTAEKSDKVVHDSHESKTHAGPALPSPENQSPPVATTQAKTSDHVHSSVLSSVLASAPAPSLLPGAPSLEIPSTDGGSLSGTEEVFDLTQQMVMPVADPSPAETSPPGEGAPLEISIEAPEPETDKKKAS